MACDVFRVCFFVYIIGKLQFSKKSGSLIIQGSKLTDKIVWYGLPFIINILLQFFKIL